MLNDTKKTRFKITVFVIAYFAILGVIAMFKDYPEITMLCIGGITASGVMYKHSEGTRPSSKEVNLLNSEEG